MMTCETPAFVNSVQIERKCQAGGDLTRRESHRDATLRRTLLTSCQSTTSGHKLDELVLIFGVENVPSSNVLTEMTPISEWRRTEQSMCSSMLAFLLCYARFLAGAVGSQQVQRELAV